MTISCEIYLSFLVSLSSKGTNFLSSLHFLYTLFRSKAVTIASSLKKNFWTFPLWMAGTLPSSFPSCKISKIILYNEVCRTQSVFGKPWYTSYDNMRSEKEINHIHLFRDSMATVPRLFINILNLWNQNMYWYSVRK